MHASRLSLGAAPGLRAACPKGIQRPFRNDLRPPKIPRHVARAADEDSDRKTGLDWDKAWSGFVDGLNRNIPVVEDRTVSRPEQKPQPSSKSPQFSKDSRRGLRENIKKQENFVLDFWSQESFFKLGGVLILILLASFLVVGTGNSPPEY